MALIVTRNEVGL